GTWVLRTAGDPRRVLAYDWFLLERRDDWLANEIILYLARTLKRLDVTSRSLLALVEPGSCFAGSLFELALAPRRSYQLARLPEDAGAATQATVTLGPMTLGPLPMGNGLARLQTRFHGDPDALAAALAVEGSPLPAEEAERLGLVTFAPDDIDWDDEIRIA